ncbi:MAG: MFS transporter [Bacteroidota bacterium]
MNLSVYDKKTVSAWAMYDWANSAYSLVITSTLYPIYFTAITGGGDKPVHLLGMDFNSDALQTYSISAAFLLIAFINPLLSSISDYSGKKKPFMYFFCLMGSIGCSSLYFFDSEEHVWIGVAGSMLAAIGYAGSIVFYNAFLPEIAPPELQDKVSAKGFSLGYLGSSLLLIFCLTMVLFPGWYGGIEKGSAIRLAFLLVGIWWFGFAQITFKRLNDRHTSLDARGRFLCNGYKELRKVWFELRHTPALKRFLLAFFLYNLAVQTVMYVATLFGDSVLHLDSSVLIATILIIQFVAIGGASLFSRLSSKYGNIKALSLNLVAWIFVCAGAYFCDSKYGVDVQLFFILLGAGVGMVMGGIQSLSRSTYSKLLPITKDHASYFSFFDVCDKFGTVVGTFIFGYIIELTGDMRNSIVIIGGFFILGLISLLRVGRNIQLQATRP